MKARKKRMSEITIPKIEYTRLIRESERRQAAIAYVKTCSFLDKDILMIILGAEDEESEGGRWQFRCSEN
jgi:hypothetical protein